MFTEEAVESFVSAKLSNNAFNESNYVVRVPLTTVSTNGIITEIANDYPSINPYVIQHALELVKAKILELLRQGRSVDVLELGTLYLKPDSTVTRDDPTVSDMPAMKVAFRVNTTTKNALADVSISSFMISDPSPVLGTIRSLKDGSTDGTLHQGYMVEIKGSNLKLPAEVIDTDNPDQSGNYSGVFFVPVTNAGEPNPDESTWIQVTGFFEKNTATYLQFYIPSGVSIDTDYYLAVRTNYLSAEQTRKSYLTGYSSDRVIVSNV